MATLFEAYVTNAGKYSEGTKKGRKERERGGGKKGKGKKTKRRGRREGSGAAGMASAIRKFLLPLSMGMCWGSMTI